ncbi:hypothetical protein IKF32_01540 [Candidatus Saccharibacteria bacterium]|nr:hypothetical protein [Candidatus Saccharibacteria bacterium]
MNTKLLEQVETDYPEYRFVLGKKFAFRPSRTIVVEPESSNFEMLLLHELSHAILGHYSFDVDIERIKMESNAWEKAKELAKNYNIEMDDEFIQTELDTYRDWLHKKSRCPNCGLTRFQTPDSQYHCPRCENLT